MSQTTATSSAVVKAEPQSPVPSAISVGNRGIVISDVETLWKFSNHVLASGLAPKAFTTREAIFVAIQMGLEVGLTPMAALQNIAVINGRPSIWGDAQLAIVRGTGQLEALEEWFEVAGKRLPRDPDGMPDNLTAVCKVKRSGFAPVESTFSVADAKQADLWNKVGPWKQYPKRMLKMRARSFALRDQFGDALRGLKSVEEIEGTSDPVEVAKPIFETPPARISAPFVPTSGMIDSTDASKATESVRVISESSDETVKALTNKGWKDVVRKPIEAESTDESVAAPTPAPVPASQIVTAKDSSVVEFSDSPLEELERILEENNIPFDALQQWAVKSGSFPQFSSYASLGDVPERTAARLVKAKLGLLKALTSDGL